MAIKITTALALVAPLLIPQAHASAIQYVPEASSYTLAYSLAIPNSSAFNFNAISYAVDNHAGIANGSFSRIAYYMELQRAGGELIYAYASMDAFTNDASKIGVPNTSSGGFFQQTVRNMNVFSNAPGVVNGSGIGTGNIEFWQYDYSRGNASGIPDADNSYDFGDQSDGAGNYGSMQIHNYGARQTILAYNNWGNGTSPADVGLGSPTGGAHPDWTFAYNAGAYTIKNLEVLVLTSSQVPEPGSLALIGLGLVGLIASRRKLGTQVRQS